MLISHEAFSQTLRKPASKGRQASGLWVAERLRTRGWGLRLVCFVRDQESYLNSRYTQLVQRLALKVDFEAYITRVMNEDTMSECDLLSLFGWIEQDPLIETVMIPFGSALDSSGAAIRARPDPYAQLLAALNLPGKVVRQSQQVRPLNQQPGRLGVALARDLQCYLEEHNPKALRKKVKTLRRAIERLARQQGWPNDPFNGLDAELRRTIRDRYQTSNASFCQRFWPAVQWHDLFPNQVSSDTNAQKPSRMLDQELKQLETFRDSLIADYAPAQSSKAKSG